MVGFLLVTAAGFSAWVAKSLWAGAAGLALVVAYNMWAWRHVELWPISEPDAKTANKVGWLAALAAWVMAFL